MHMSIACGAAAVPPENVFTCGLRGETVSGPHRPCRWMVVVLVAGGPSGRPYRGLGTCRLRATHGWLESPAAINSAWSGAHPVSSFHRQPRLARRVCADYQQDQTKNLRRTCPPHEQRSLLLETCRSA